MHRMTKWYRANENRPGLREEYNARQRRWYWGNIEKGRALGRKHTAKYRKAHPRKARAATERCRIERGKRNRVYIENYKRKHGCIKCGERDPIVLDLHHRNPKEKDFTISKWLFRASLKILDAEFLKCDVLCANCHRREHYRRQQRKVKSGKRKC